jgi:SAM-dependent methyltransferase
MTATPSDPPNLFRLISVPESSEDFDISDPEVLRMLEESQRRHFWFDARNRQIIDLLRREGVAPPALILEIGCGTGTVLSALREAGYRMVGVEMHGELARRAAERNPDSAIYALDIFDPPPELRRHGPFDVVAALDVVEHLPEPERFLRAGAALLRSGGLLMGTVPALGALWTDYDRYAGHRIRHRRTSLRQVFSRAGLPDPRLTYFFQALVPGMLARRVLIGRSARSSDLERRAAQHLALDPPGPLLNRVLSSACALERGIRRRFPAFDRVPGASLAFCVTIPDPDGIRSGTRARES